MGDRESGLGIYILAHGAPGRERLRVLARVMEEGTTRLLQGVGIAPGAHCLDVGCGGGDVSVLLARLAGPTGKVVGVDFDPVKVEMAAGEAAAQRITNLSYRTVSVYDLPRDEHFDVVFARFLLSHLSDPATALERMLGALRPGGVVIVEDVEFSAHFCWPRLPAMDAFVRLYTAIASSTGGDPEIGPKLSGMMQRAGLADVGMQVHQPAGLEGDAKLMTPLTMQSIGARVIDAGLAGPAEVRRLVNALAAAAEDPGVTMSTPRVYQCWGRKQ